MATTKNIAITINNGLDYDTLYPTCNLANYTGTLPLTATSGTLALTRGGTGGTSASAGLYNLINGTTALASTGLATGDYVGVGDVSAASGKKVTMTNLATYLSGLMSGGASIASGTATPTGVMPTAGSTCYTLAVGFTPKFFMCGLYGNVIGGVINYSKTAGVNGYCTLMREIIVYAPLTTTGIRCSYKVYSSTATFGYAMTYYLVKMSGTNVVITYQGDLTGAQAKDVYDTICSNEEDYFYWLAIG